MVFVINMSSVLSGPGLCKCGHVGEGNVMLESELSHGPNSSLKEGGLT